MKNGKIRFNLVVFAMMFLLISTISYAQRGRYYNDRKGERPNRSNTQTNFTDQLDLSDEQKEKIDEIKLAASKESLQRQNKIAELEAQLTTALTEDKVDQNKTNKLVEEIGDLNTAARKQRIDTHLKIRNLLTDNQKVIFDQRISRRSFGRSFHGGYRM